jgi:membrane-bound lytic murein transglycosylase F
MVPGKSLSILSWRNFVVAVTLLIAPFYLLSRYVEWPGFAPIVETVRLAWDTGTGPGPDPSQGQLRILYLAGTGVDTPSPIEKNLLQQFAQNRGQEPVWIPVKDGWHQIQALIKGEGDVAVPPGEPLATGPDLPVRETLAWGQSRLQVVGRDSSSAVEQPTDPEVRQIVLRRSSPAWSMLQSLRQEYPALDLMYLPDTVTDSQILHRVQTGRYDLAVLDSMTLQSYLPDYPDLKVTMSLGDRHARRWLVRGDAAGLQASLNRFLNKKHLELNVAQVYREDLPLLQKRKVLRLITNRSPINYFFDDGRFKGFEYELIKRFARQHHMRLDVVLADTQADMQTLLRQGRGDVIAASTPEQAYAAMRDIAVTSPYNYSAPVVVGSSRSGRLVDVSDLNGHSIWLPAESPWYDLLQSLRRQGVNIQIHRAEPGANTEAVLFHVARGMYDLAVIGSQEVKAEFSRQLDLKVQFPITAPRPLVWAVRKSNTRLQSALNDFIAQEYRQSFYNVVYAKYVNNPEPRKASIDLLAGVNQLSPFDKTVHDYAERYGFDWRLIVAQMYQESRFKPDAVSRAGAQGLMQLLPTTAEQVGVDQRDDPVTSIRGGIRYLDYLRSRFEGENLPLEERTWFTLAAYNAGYNRVKRAREVAEKMHLNSNRWFDNVEKAMLAMSRPYRKDGELVRYCRCGQTVAYVREIRTLYNNYVQLTQSIKTAATENSLESGDTNAL